MLLLFLKKAYLITNVMFCLFSRVIEKIDQSEFEGFEYVNPLLMSLEDCV